MIPGLLYRVEKWLFVIHRTQKTMSYRQERAKTKITIGHFRRAENMGTNIA